MADFVAALLLSVTIEALQALGGGFTTALLSGDACTVVPTA
jgi:hypothetical protein